MIDNNVEYYNINADSFYNGTVNVDMSPWRDKFENYVPDGGRILDVGCGSGRDSRAFKMHGYSVVAIDASKEMCKRASELLDQEVWQMRFEEIAFKDEFNGIWACASLLHVSQEELPNILKKLREALTPNGVLYVSFKYGEGTSTKGERTFSNFNEKTAKILLENSEFDVKDCGITNDARPDRNEEKWINLIALAK